MKRRFTILTAALALLTFLTIPMGVWGQSTYNKVTTAPSNWSGTYVIVADESSVIFTGQSGTNNYGGYAAVTISNNSVTGDFAAYEVEIEQSGTYYSIKHINSSKYLGWTSGNSLAFNTSAPTADSYRWVLSTSSILNANDNSRKLQYNSGSPRFACYTSNQKVAYLYKKETGDTNTCATPTFNPAAGVYTSAQNVSISCSTEGATIYYTTDGNDPTTSSTTYSAPINVSSDMTIKAMATAEGYDNSAVATAEYTIITLDHAGTLADPYNVADARAAIDANAGVTGVYATGIVSAIPTAYSTQYSNITFNFVDNEGDNDFLQAFRCGGNEAANVVVGDVVVVYGDLTKYGSTYEFGQGCTLVSLTHPVSTDPSITVNPATVNATYEETSGTLTVTYENITEVVAEVSFCDANGGDIPSQPDWIVAEINAENNVEYMIEANEGEARTAYLKVSALDDNTEYVYSNIVTINQAEYVAPALDYATLPFEFNGVRADIEGTDGLTAEGLGTDYNATNNPTTKLKFDGTGDWLLLQFNERPGTLTFDIKNNSFSGGTFTVQTSEDGVTYTDLETYTEITGTQSEEFTDLGENVRFIKWIYTEKSSGNVGLGNIHLSEFGGVPVASITVNPATVNAPAEETSGTITVTYVNINEVVAEVSFCDANGGDIPSQPDWIVAEINAENNVEYMIEANEGEARTAYLKVSALDDNAQFVYSDIVTINQAAYVAPALDYATLPFEFNGGRADIEGIDGLTAEGLGTDYNATSNSTTKLKFDGTGDWMILHINEVPGTLTFAIKGNGFSGGTFTVQTSEDGVTYEDLAAYTELGDVETKTIDDLDENVRYIKWIYTEKSSGNVGLGDIHLYEFGGGPAPVASITVNPATVSVDSDEHDGTLALTYENLEISAMTDFHIQYYDGNEVELTEVPDWIEVLVAEQDPTIGEGYVVSYFMSENEGEARSAYFKVYALDANEELVYSNLVTINQAEYVAPFEGATYTLASSIESGRRYIITNGNDKAMGGQNNNNRAAITVTTTPNGVEVSSADVVELVINGPDANGFYTIYDANIPGYLYAASGSSNYLKTETHLDANNNGLWSIEFGAEGDVTVKAQGNNTRNWMRYNSGSDIFSCYSGGQQPIYLYVKDEETPTYTFYKDIKGYNGANGGYYFIATPVDDINPAEVPGMTEGAFDLYWFDQTEVEAWRNYEDQTTGNYNLTSCMGYLYANNDDVTLAFNGTPTSNHSIALVKDDDADFPGYNLVGNPFGQVAYINKPFYTLNADGSELITDPIEGTINPMEGVFVVADTDGEDLTFSTVQGTNTNDRVVMNVYGSRANVIDRAIIRFDENKTLPKFQLNPNSTKLYIPQDDVDYAVVYSEANGEIPVSFKAATNGTYTLNVNVTDIEMDYLYLIDNMTGEDVDLLATPSYSFEAKTSDYSSRFRLVFGTNSVNENAAETFAFFNGSEWQISNAGKATLQIVDVMGRVLSSETVDGNATISTNDLCAGVYMMRLVSGNNVKVQKVIVR